MEKWMSIDDAVAQIGVSKRTVYRRIKEGKLQTQEVNGQTQVLVTLPDTESQSDTTLVIQLRSEIEYLRQQNDHLTQVLALAHKNIDSLVQQVESKDLLLEDLRQPVPFWQRFRRQDKKSSNSRRKF